MLDLNQIFPSTYLDMPSWQDIEIMLQEILNRSDSVDMVVSKIDKEPCPYYKETLIRCLQDRYPLLYKSDKEMLGYYSSDCWYPYWPEPKDKFRELINQYQAEQKAIPVLEPEQEECNIPTAEVKLPPVVYHSDIQEVPTATTIKQIVSGLKQVVKEFNSLYEQNMQPITIHIPVYINPTIYTTHNDNNNCNVLQGPMYDTQFTK